MVIDIYVLLEVLAIHLCGVAVAVYYVHGQLGVKDFCAEYLMVMVALPVLYVAIAKSRRLYEFRALCSFSSFIGRAIACLLLAFGLLIVAGFMLGVASDFSRVWYALWVVTALPAVMTLRALASGAFVKGARSGLIRRNAAIYGSREAVGRLQETIGKASPEIRVVQSFVAAARGRGRPSASAAISALVDFGQKHDLDLIIVAPDADSYAELPEILSTLSVLPAEVHVSLDFGERNLPIRGVSTLDRMQLLDVQRRPISGWGRLLKTLEDYSVGTIALAALLPAFLVIAIAIKLESKGPVFFKQRRHGFNHKIITVWKFRTMRVMEDGDDFVQAVHGDARVTRVGRFLRATSLDELPQLINVMLGDMSIVGPRPHPLALNNQYIDLLESYGNRHKVKPGITGWAQINGFRGPTGDPYLMQKRVEYDLEYIEKWSVWMDLKIIAATPFRGLVHENAV